jgi:hypothetical protein
MRKIGLAPRPPARQDATHDESKWDRHSASAQ